MYPIQQITNTITGAGEQLIYSKSTSHQIDAIIFPNYNFAIIFNSSNILGICALHPIIMENCSLLSINLSSNCVMILFCVCIVYLYGFDIVHINAVFMSDNQLITK